MMFTPEIELNSEKKISENSSKEIFGFIKIPANQWSSFKRSILQKYNALLKRDYYYANILYQFLIEKKKTEKNFTFRKAFSLYIQEYNFHWDTVERIEKSLFKEANSKKLYKPKAKNFKLATNQTKRIDIANFSFSFINSSKEIHLNIHSLLLDEFEKHPILNFIFLNLDQNISWNRNSGGIIFVSHRENILHHKIYGPIGNKQKNSNLSPIIINRNVRNK